MNLNRYVNTDYDKSAADVALKDYEGSFARPYRYE